VTPAPDRSDTLSDPDSQRQREALRRGLRRANLASVLILVLLVALAFGFVWKARQSTEEAERASVQAQRANAEADRARQASTRAEDELWNARLNEMRARESREDPGRALKAARPCASWFNARTLPRISFWPCARRPSLNSRWSM